MSKLEVESHKKAVKELRLAEQKKYLKQNKGYNNGYENGFKQAKHDFKALLAEQRKKRQYDWGSEETLKIIDELESELK